MAREEVEGAAAAGSSEVEVAAALALSSASLALLSARSAVLPPSRLVGDGDFRGD